MKPRRGPFQQGCHPAEALEDDATAVPRESSRLLEIADHLDALYSARPSHPFREMPYYKPSPRFAQTFCKGWDAFEFPTTDTVFGRNRGVPFEVILKIFSWLDGREMAYVRCVAQSWRLIINQNLAKPITCAEEQAAHDAEELERARQPSSLRRLRRLRLRRVRQSLISTSKKVLPEHARAYVRERCLLMVY